MFVDFFWGEERQNVCIVLVGTEGKPGKDAIILLQSKQVHV